MSFLSRAESWSNIIKNFVIVGGIVVAVFLLGISIYANATEDRPGGAGLPKAPPVDKAAWEVTIKNTGNVLYTDSYEQPSEGVYVLHGYYEIHESKYESHTNDLVLDDNYFGDIIFKKR
jgi:hypothetical protein